MRFFSRTDFTLILLFKVIIKMSAMREKLEQLFENFKGLKVLILGDVMIDSYIWGKVDRISPEAPVPVVLVNKRTNMLGGAANVALNIKSLGAEPILCSFVGNDSQGRVFVDLLKHDNISTDGILLSDSRITTTKFRIIGNKVQLLRVDDETDHDLDEKDEILLLSKIKDLIREEAVDVIIMQDYNKGVLTPEIIKQVIEIAGSLKIPVIVDPKRKNFDCYKNVDLFKPNLKELKEGLKIDIDIHDLTAIDQASAAWQEQQSINSLMVTLSENGIFLRYQLDGKSTKFHIPAHVRKIADVSGAGDTVISVASLCRALNADLQLTAALANIAGGLVCEHIGVVPVDGNQLLLEAIQLLK